MYHPPLMISSSSAPLIARSFARRPYAGRIVAIGSQAFCAKACAMSSAMLDAIVVAIRQRQQVRYFRHRGLTAMCHLLPSDDPAPLALSLEREHIESVTFEAKEMCDVE